MTYGASKLKADLENELAKGYDPVRIAKQVFKVYFEQGRDIDPEIDNVMMQLVAMEQGPDFELSEAQFRALLKTLQL